MKEGVVCFILCFGWTPPQMTPSGDTFCANYERVVKSKEELKAVQSLPQDIRRRIQGNDLDYLCNCRGWEDAACHSKSTQK